jgi:hypothetical protein
LVWEPVLQPPASASTARARAIGKNRMAGLQADTTGSAHRASRRDRESDSR